MRMTQLAYRNFKGNMKNYLSLVISLAFTILVFLNFQNIIYSDSFAGLGSQNKDNADMLIQVCSFVLGCFMFFFIGYATNVFLTKRKKEIGTYVFMGLSNEKLGKLYLVEISLTGLSALLLGVFCGILTTGLFQMILLALSDMAVEIQFVFSLKPVLITAGIYLVMYLFFALRGYFSIVRSSVLSMISASKQNEYVRANPVLLLLKTFLGVCVLSAGFYLAVKESEEGVMANVLLAVIFVTIGVYLLFGGLIPAVFQGLAGNKRFLYHKEHCLWMNSLIFRMKKNYRTYAMVCVLALCSVTALATGFAMKYRYENMVHFENTYTFQLFSNRTDLYREAAGILSEKSEISYSSQIPVLCVENSVFGVPDTYVRHAILSYGNLKMLAQDAGLEFDLTEPGEDEVISLTHIYMLSLITDRSNVEVNINGKIYRQIQESDTPYLGYLQEIMSFYVVNDAEYEKLLPLGMQQYAYNYRIGRPEDFTAARDALDVLVSSTDENATARIAMDPNADQNSWIRIAYSLCIFMFLVFVFASGSILFMKLYNDAFEERERYGVMIKLGIDTGVLKRSVRREMLTTYAIPFVVMGIASCFSVHALGKMMYSDLRGIHGLSLLIIFVIFVLCRCLSVWIYQKNVGLDQ